MACVPLRNEVCQRLANSQQNQSKQGPGRLVRLATGEEGIFWFDVGPCKKPKDKVIVTDAACPHQGLGLMARDLQDIEDVAGVHRAMVRCPRHNKNFDLRTGESPGSTEVL